MILEKPKAFAAKHKDESVRVASRSGGIFTALSDNILEKEGIIYGCVLTEDFKAIHIRTDSAVIRNQMRGSKYIQSKLGDSYRNVKEDLTAGKSVLFSGTSCQVAGLKNFLGKEYNNLVCVDIICHGVPSPKVFEKYIIWQQSKIYDKIKNINFRNKQDFGWREHIETLTTNKGKQINSRVFAKLFYGHTILRPCCYECPYKSLIHPGNITIADYWGIERAAPEFDDNRGVSLVLINDEKGEDIFRSIQNRLDYKATKIEDSWQPALMEPSSRPIERELFWKDFNKYNFNYIAKKYGNDNILNNIKVQLKMIKRKLFN